MKPLEVYVRNRMLYVKFSIKEKGIGHRDYTLEDKNGQSIYIFRQEMSNFRLAYGELADDVREACIDALILRFDTNCVEMFYYKNERKVVDVSFAQGADNWAVYVNRTWIGSIRAKSSSVDLKYHEHNPCEALTPERIAKYIQWIREGKIKGAR